MISEVTICYWLGTLLVLSIVKNMFSDFGKPKERVKNMNTIDRIENNIEQSIFESRSTSHKKRHKELLSHIESLKKKHSSEPKKIHATLSECRTEGTHRKSGDDVPDEHKKKKHSKN